MVWLLAAFVIILLVMLVYPLLEVLLWRRLWLRRLSQVSEAGPQGSAAANEWSSALLYLSGISDFTSVDLLPQQTLLLAQTAKVINPDRCLPRAFPYDPAIARAFQRFDLWPRLGFTVTPLWIWSLRNFWQAWLASWLPRWYGAAVARCFVHQLGVATSPRQLVVIGNSAGAAILLSAAPHLRKAWPSLHMTAIICGGVLGESAGFAALDAFHQLLGTQDPWPKLATLIFPRRQLTGAWQQASDAQRYQQHQIGPMTHFGSDGYYGDKYVGTTSEFMVALLRDSLSIQIGH